MAFYLNLAGDIMVTFVDLLVLPQIVVVNMLERLSPDGAQKATVGKQLLLSFFSLFLVVYM